MTNTVDPRWLEVAKKGLLCHCGKFAGPHRRDCPAYYRTVFAKDLQDAFEAGCSHGWEEAENMARDGHLEI